MVKIEPTNNKLQMTNRSPFLTGATIVIVVLVGAVSVQAFQSLSLSPTRKAKSWWGFSLGAGASTALPSDVVKYSQVPKNGTFTAAKIPKGLLKDHTTKAGTWGLIRVSQGTLEYTVLEPSHNVQMLTAPATGVIVPQMLHHVKAMSDDVEFVVEFYRLPGTGPVNEKREGL